MKRLSTLILWTFLLLIKAQILLASENPSPYFFIENKGQWPVDVLYRADLPGGKLHLHKNTLKYVFYDISKFHQHHARPASSVPMPYSKVSIYEGDLINAHGVEVNYIGANSDCQIVANNKRGEYYNYFLNNDSSKWASNVQGYEGVTYKNLYNGIDLKIYGIDDVVKYDFIISPNFNPSEIVLKYTGADHVYIENGNLYVKTSVNTIIEQKPYAYQISGKKKKEVLCKYHLKDNKLTFVFPKGYNKSQTLVIDRILA